MIRGGTCPAYIGFSPAVAVVENALSDEHRVIFFIDMGVAGGVHELFFLPQATVTRYMFSMSQAPK